MLNPSLITSAEQGPSLGLLSTLDTLLVLAFWEVAVLLLVERNTQRFGSSRRSFGIFCDTLVSPASQFYRKLELGRTGILIGP